MRCGYFNLLVSGFALLVLRTKTGAPFRAQGSASHKNISLYCLVAAQMRQSVHQYLKTDARWEYYYSYLSPYAHALVCMRSPLIAGKVVAIRSEVTAVWCRCGDAGPLVAVRASLDAVDVQAGVLRNYFYDAGWVVKFVYEETGVVCHSQA